MRGVYRLDAANSSACGGENSDRVILQVVVLIGSSASADDISRDIARVAKEVHVASRSFQVEDIGKLPGHDNIWLQSMVKLLQFK